MRVFEHGQQSHTGRPFRIAVIGSCRVCDPFEDLANAGKLLRVWKNNQVSPLTFGEAHQIIRYTRLDKDLPSEFKKFIFENVELAPAPRSEHRRIVDSIDAFVVEISDVRQFVCGDIYFQFNYFWKNFISHHGAPVLPWYQAFSRRLNISDEIVEAVLNKIGPASHDERLLVEQVMRRTRLEELDVEDMIAWIERIRFKPEAEWLFVSHFMVPGAEGTLMNDRKKLRERLRAATTACGVQMFDPTEIVARHGREVALANAGADVYHYNPSFQAVIAESLLDLINDPVGRTKSVASGPMTDQRTGHVQTAARLNELLVPFHRERLHQFGVDKSGLYAHYENLIATGEIITSREVAITDLITRFLPAYSCCHVLKAGLGEIALLLSGTGLTTLATEPNEPRCAALVESVEFLQKQRIEAAEGLEITQALFPNLDTERKVLAVAAQLDVGYSLEQEEALLTILERYHGIVFNPLAFIRRRERPSEQDAFIAQMRRHGFDVVRDFPELRLVYCAKSEVWSCGAKAAPPLAEPVAAGGEER